MMCSSGTCNPVGTVDQVDPVNETPRAHRHADGFTLLEIIIAVALVAIMAGAIAPVAIKQVAATRTNNTLQELDQIRCGILAFYTDLGRLPTDAEGLTILVSATGLTGGEATRWQGPYVSGGSGNIIAEITHDAFGNTYVFDATATVVPAAAGSLVVSSIGVNRTQDMPDAANWIVANAPLHDDLVVFISAAEIERNNHDQTVEELEDIATATRSYYQNEGSFPGSLAALSNTYLDPGYLDSAFSDQWYSDYQMSVSGGGNPVMKIWSPGPDRTDDSGTGDDLLLEVNSAAL